MKYVSEHSLEQLKYVAQEVNFQEYGSTSIEIGEQIQIEEHTIQELQENHIDPTSKLQQQEHTQITSNLQSQQQI